MRVNIQLYQLFRPQCELVYQDYHEYRLYRGARGHDKNMNFTDQLSWIKERT